MDPAIQRARENIATLKGEIRKKKAEIADYEDRIATGRGNFPEAGLRNGIEQCQKHLEVFKAAILKEKAGIREMEGQAKIREEMAAIMEGVEIPVEYEGEE